MSHAKRLVDLAPSWVYYLGDGEWMGLYEPPAEVPPNAVRVGISFRCPCDLCAPHGDYMRIAIPLQGCPDEGNWYPNKLAWSWSGDTFENLTTNPSIDRSKTPGCSFHGWLKNGEVTW